MRENAIRAPATALAALVMVALAGEARAQEPAGRGETLERAFAELRLDPHNPYLQFVVLQLARRTGQLDDWARRVELLGRERNARRGRSDEVDAFSLFSGALAVQESLQLDTMRGEGQGQDRDGPTVDVADLEGPTIESHPWREMLRGREPTLSPIARMVPADFFLVESSSLQKLLDAFEGGDLWALHLMQQVAPDASSQDVAARLRRQLAIETSGLLRPLYDQVVAEVGITGSDLYLREGSDVTLLFRLRQPALFRARLDGFLAAAAARPGAQRTRGEILGVPFEHVATPDREVSVFSAYPAEDLHVRSNSKAALARVLAAIAGKDARGESVVRLADTDELRYIRTLMPRGAPEEDVFVYLSDPFIRRLVGPELKLTEQRRMVCYNHLRMVGHGGLLFLGEHGRTARSLDELAQQGCAPGHFGKGELCCPDGGQYGLSADGLAGTCSHHGHARALTPCIEIPVRQVLAAEAEAYAAFRQDYDRYWRRFFDPIALRLQLAPKRYRLETIVLPLIDASIYSDLATVLGGAPEPLDALPVPTSNILSVALKLDKESLLREAGGAPWNGRELRELGLLPADVDGLLRRGLGQQIGFHVCDARPMFDFNLPDFVGRALGSFGGGRIDDEELWIGFLVASLNAPVYVSIPVADRAVVDGFLQKLDRALAVASRVPARDAWFELEYDFYKMNEEGLDLRCGSMRWGPVKWRMFWARIGDGLYLASKPSILQELTGAQPPKRGPQGHAAVRLRPEHWAEVLADFRLGWAEQNRRACLGNLGSLGAVARACGTGAAPAGASQGRDPLALAARLYGTRFFCPDGGEYRAVATGAECSVHGSIETPVQQAAPSRSSDLGELLTHFAGMTAAITFEPEGLRAVVEIDRR